MNCRFVKIFFLICLSLSGYAVPAQQRICDLGAICISPADTVINGQGLILRFGRKNLGPDIMFSNDTTFYTLYRIVGGQRTVDYSGAFGRRGSHDTVGVGDSTVYRDNYSIGFVFPGLTEPLVLDYCVRLDSWGVNSQGDTLRFSYHDSNAANNTCCKQVVVIPTPKETAIADLDLASDGFTIYPNPVRHTLYLRTAEGLSADALQLTIVDLMGRKMLVKYGRELQWSNGVMSIDVGLLPAGLYQVNLFMSKGMVTKRFSVYK